MYLSVCEPCAFGTEKNGKSFCEKEACYSYLAKCIKNKALEDYLARNASQGGCAEKLVQGF